MKQTIKTGHRVTSADGTLYEVRYVHERHGDADLRQLDESGGWRSDDPLVTLPLNELKRVPKDKALPIEGMPDRRPRCPMCDMPLKPDLDKIREDGQSWFKPLPPGVSKMRLVKRIFRGWRGYPIERGNAWDKFCSTRCARQFANAAFVAGYRIKRKGQPK
jgi:hypothetical protein